MTIETLRIVVTLLSFACFAGLLLWTWSARHRRGFDEAARLPFAHDADVHRSDAP